MLRNPGDRATVDTDEHRVIVVDQPGHTQGYVLVPHRAHQKASERLVTHIREGQFQTHRVGSLDGHGSDIASRNHLHPREILERRIRRGRVGLILLQVGERHPPRGVTDAAEHGPGGYRGTADAVQIPPDLERLGNVFAENLFLEAGSPQKVPTGTAERFVVVDDGHARDLPHQIHPHQHVDPAAVAVLGGRYIGGQVHVADYAPRRPIQAGAVRGVYRRETPLRGETVGCGHHRLDHLVVDRLTVSVLGSRRRGNQRPEGRQTHPPDRT